MTILNDTVLESNKYLKLNFDGGDLSSDAGLLLIKEFACKLGFVNILKKEFKTNDSASFRFHKDDENLWQVIYQILGAYFEDDCADELTNDPILTAVLAKNALASQPTLSRFFNRLDNTTLNQFYDLMRRFRKVVYSIKKPEMILLDLDSTLLNTYGHQEGEGFNFHYQDHGYHPLVCYDGITGDLLKIQLRNGTDYSSTGVMDFLQPLLDEFGNDYPDIPLLLRGDSGFTKPELYHQCETNGVSYAIRLKENGNLRKLASHIDEQLTEITKDDMVSYAVCYGEFQYRAGSWEYPRRVVCKVEKPTEQLIHMYTFIVTNMDSEPEKVIRFYSKLPLLKSLAFHRHRFLPISFARNCKRTITAYFILSYICFSVKSKDSRILAASWYIYSFYRSEWFFITLFQSIVIFILKHKKYIVKFKNTPPNPMAYSQLHMSVV